MNTDIDGHDPHPVRLVVEDATTGTVPPSSSGSSSRSRTSSSRGLDDPRHRRRDRRLDHRALHRQAAAGSTGSSAPTSATRRTSSPTSISSPTRTRLRRSPGEYPIDIELPEEPVTQPRWTMLLRLILAIPALLIGGGLPAASANFSAGKKGARSNFGTGSGGLLAVSAFLGWFASVALGRMPKGLRDTGAWSVGYRRRRRRTCSCSRHVTRTPTRPRCSPTVERPPLHPVRVVGDPYDLRRSRVTVFFRLPLSIPLSSGSCCGRSSRCSRRSCSGS